VKALDGVTLKVEIETFRITNHVVENFKSLCTECRQWKVKE